MTIWIISAILLLDILSPWLLPSRSFSNPYRLIFCCFYKKSTCKALIPPREDYTEYSLGGVGILWGGECNEQEVED
jgi:hypothetical protein